LLTRLNQLQPTYVRQVRRQAELAPDRLLDHTGTLLECSRTSITGRTRDQC
jgi:hypothetical protein